METSHAANPASLPPGTRIGPWRVVAWRGEGRYGVIYRAEHAEGARSGFFALKLSRVPGDPRFEREGELLSLLHHPNLPRLHDRGEWTGPGGALFPYLVMDWVEGMPLYEWAREHSASSLQVMRLLAPLARAVQAIHEAGGVHRDIKGENILVRAKDDQPVLVDFGACTYRGASTLTRRLPPPGTPRYMSPESQRFQWRHRRQATARYEARPADDVYALGMTAYRLVTGRYPPFEGELEDSVGPDDTLLFPALVPPEALVHLSPELARWIRQMLSDEPSARGSAAEVAHALERAARRAGREANRPITPRTSQDSAASEPTESPLSKWSEWRKWLVVTGASGALAASIWLVVRENPLQSLTKAAELSAQARARVEGGESTGLAERGLTEVRSIAKPEPVRNGLSLDMPKKPVPGQREPPCEGYEVEINGGCWWPVANAVPPCGKRVYEWKNACYSPSLDSQQPRPPTSDQP